MTLFKTILCAADFSESSREAFRVACSLAREGETKILVLHVLEAVHIAQEPVPSGQETLPFSRGEGNQGYHESVKERLRQTYVSDRPIETEYLISDGPTTHMILRAAEEEGCDLIAMGTHGRTGLSRVLAGSVAEAVLREARCPVLVLRSPEPGKSLARDVHAILHPSDFSNHSQTAAGIARTLAGNLGARLVLLHVAPMEEVVPGEVGMPMDPEESHVSLEALRKQLEGPDLKSPIEVVHSEGDVASEILRTAETKGCDLLVLGTHGRTGLLRLLMGSLAEAVLRRSKCPVLMVKPRIPITESTPESESFRGLKLAGDGA
ncbi:MAG TPA: universal stress protein [Isosphaeraceae bacterium]|nr:universal stress protein [Isosphaeraceae bacterium]